MENPYARQPNQHKTAVDENIALKQEREAMAQALAAKDEEIARMNVAGQQIATERDQLVGIMQDPTVDANVGGLQRQGLGQGPQDGQGPGNMQQGQQNPVEDLAIAIAEGTLQPEEAYEFMLSNGSSEEEAGMLVNDAMALIDQADQMETPLPQVPQY